MINFEDEIEKFKPVLEVEQIEKVISGNEVQDLMDVLRQLAKQIVNGKE
ncbi:hypothetical protein FACS189490_07790 [Clostridia bacterium]|nr:hypothetical protein FACS189490_07790 [Clostridia bacterium]